MSEDDKCTVCQFKIRKSAWKLPCKHTFHSKCIRAVYDANINRVDELTLRRIEPSCPNCRKKFHKKDVPRPPPEKEETIDLELLSVPAFSAMPVDDRPWRQARDTPIIQAEQVERAIRVLVAERARLSRRPTSEPEFVILNDITPTTSGNSRDRAIRRPVLDSSSSSSQETQPSQQPVEPSTSPLLQDIQMQITILQNQLELVQSLPERDEADEDIEIPDNESETSEIQENSNRPQLVGIERHFGRGRNCKYLCRWSDDVRTLARKSDLVQLDKQLFDAYKKECLKINTRNCRKRQKLATQNPGSTDSS